MNRATCAWIIAFLRGASSSPTSSARIQELTRGVGADATLECVGTQQAMMQAIRLAARS